MKTDWTEAKLQRHLAMRFNRTGSLCVPNCGVFGWEADLVRVSPSLIASEYEIKVTLADFRADAAKRWKHMTLANNDGRRAKGMTPQRFWYAAPEGVVPIGEVPEHAGLIEIVGRDIVKRKTAPKLHGEKMSLKHMLFVSRGAALRYWERANA